MRAPRALVFDFDGLILDTETPEFLAWQELFAAHGARLVAADWAHVIGSLDSGWNAAAEIRKQTGASVDEAELRKAWKARQVELLALESVRPGVEALLKQAVLRGLGVAVASSSSRWWVESNLERIGLLEAFPVIATGDEVPRTKPDPVVYLLALSRLAIEPADALAFEDSPNGIRAARAAGLRCIAVPNAVSRHLDLSAADAVVPSLSTVDLDDLPFA